LRRPDLGVLLAGAQADIVLVDLSRPTLQPVFDPLRTLVWYASSRDIQDVMIAGSFVMRDGRYLRGDAAEVARRARQPVEAIWRAARDRGLI
jgi:5-methylthioadenosine/S-adenosylhomocysteine deaminase